MKQQESVTATLNDMERHVTDSIVPRVNGRVTDEAIACFIASPKTRRATARISLDLHRKIENEVGVRWTE